MRSRRPALHEAWLWITGLVLALGYLFRLDGLLVLGALLAVVLVMAWYWNRNALAGIHYERWFFYRRGFPGETIAARLLLENRKPLPLVWLKTEDRWPRAVAPRGEEGLHPTHKPEIGQLRMIVAMRPYSRTVRPLTLELQRRGVYRLGPVAATSGDPFGLFVSHQEDIGSGEKIVVFPPVRPLSDLSARPDDPFGDRPSNRQLFEDRNRPIGVREYQPGDGFRRIHWPATARTGELHSKLFQPARGLDLMVCLNASTFAHHWEGTDPPLLESVIETVASIVYEGYQQGYRVGLLSNGAIAHSGRAFTIPPGRSKAHLPLVLEALAGLTPLVTAPFERYLLSQAPKMEFGSILMVVTAVVTEELVETLLRLRSRNRRTTLISLAAEPPAYMEGVETYHAAGGEGLRFA